MLVYQLSVDSQHAPRFLELTGPHVQRRIPIPRAGVEAALELFFSRLFTGTLLLLLVGLVVNNIPESRRYPEIWF